MKKLLLTFLSFVLYFNSFSSAYAAGLGGWSLSNPIAQGASTLYQGAKNVMINGKNVAKTSTALITPAAADVAKVLRGGAAGYALSIAVEQLLGAVDWVLDPANNQIVYTKPNDPVVDPANPDPTIKKFYKYNKVLYKTSTAACEAWLATTTAAAWGGKMPTVKGNDSGQCQLYGGGYNYNGNVGAIVQPVENTAYDPAAEKPDEDDKPKTLPLDVVAQQVISNAAGDSAAQEATTAAAADIVSEAEKDAVKARPIVNQLEANSKTATDETATGEAVPKDPTAPDAAKPTHISLEFPVFCGWAPIVCEAAQKTLTFPNTLVEWWETANDKAQNWAKSISEAWVSAKDWATSEKQKDNEPTEVDVLQDTLPDLNKDLFKASGQCPPDFTYPFPLPLGGSFTVTYSYATACFWFSKLYYVVVLVASIIGLKIVTGVDGNKDG